MAPEICRRVPELVWLDGIAKAPSGAWHLMAMRKAGRSLVRESVPFPSPISEVIDTNAPWLNRVSTRAQSLNIRDIGEAEKVLYPQELFNKFSTDIEISDAHEIYKIESEEPIYLPAELLIRALFCGTRLLDSHLLIPGGIDTLGVAHAEGDAIHVQVSRSVSASDITARTARVLAWMMTDRGARMAHASVLQAALSGRLAMYLPSIAMRGWVRGIEVDPGLLAVQLLALDIRLPIYQKEIVVHVGKRVKRFASYEPPKRSPWSQSIERAPISFDQEAELQ